MNCENLRYEPLPEWTQEEMEAVLERADPIELALLPLTAGLNPPDRDWTLATCLLLAKHDDPDIRGNALLGIAYLGHSFDDLPEAEIRDLLDRASYDPDEWVRMRAGDAMDDLSGYCKWEFPNTP
jgi:hypothetical protein